MPDEFGETGRGRRDDIDMALSAYRSMRSPVAYVSMPITTGKRLYDVLERKGIRTLDELASVDPQSVRSEIIEPNIERGIEIADGLRKRTKLPPIAPAVFDARRKGWSQKDYLLLWLRVIEEKAQEVYMTDGWEYSDGAAREFQNVIFMQFDFINPESGMEGFPEGADLEKEYRRLKKTKVYTESGKEIRIDSGFKLMAKAVFDLHERGFEHEGLSICLFNLINTAMYYHDPWTWRHEYHERQPYIDYNWQAMAWIHDRLLDLKEGKNPKKRIRGHFDYPFGIKDIADPETDIRDV